MRNINQPGTVQTSLQADSIGITTTEGTDF